MKKILLNTFLLLFIFSLNAQNWGEQILNQQNQGGNYFYGFSVDIDGDYAIVGALGENERTGSAHIYKKDANGTWNFHQKIEAYVGKHSDEYFGWAVAIQNDLIFVSARTDRLNEEKFEGLAGSVMIYKKDANDVWNGIQRIRSADIRIGDNFGYDLAIDGDYLLVGANGQDYNENNVGKVTSAGAAYLFKKDANDMFTEVQKLTPSHRDSSDKIGSSVSISGDYLVLASKNDTDADNVNEIRGNGSAFVFKKGPNNVWTEIQKLNPSNNSTYSNFGYGDVTISNDFIAIGANSLDVYDEQSNNWFYGHVFLFKKNNDNIWEESQIIKTPFPASNFGSGVSLDDNLLLVSAPKSRVEDNGSNVLNVGLSYLFVKNANDNFVLAETIQASQVDASSTIGEGEWDGNPSTASIAISDNHFIIGAPNIDLLDNNPIVYNSGAAFISGNVEELGLLNVLSIDDNLQTSISFYPNPIKNKLNIRLSEKHQKIKLNIFNIIGKSIINKEIENTNNLKIDFNFPKGIYLAKITLEDNSTKVIKLIKN